MFNKKILILAAFFLLLTFACIPPDEFKGIRIQYFEQQDINYCAVANIQMWQDYNLGICVSQDDIATYCNITPAGLYPHEVVRGVKWYVNEPFAYLARKSRTSPGAMGDILASTILAYDGKKPSILFLDDGVHTVLTTYFSYHTDVSGRPIADTMNAHDPDRYEGGPNLEFTYADLDFRFRPVNGEYIAVIESISSLYGGIDWHDAFVEAGGTYYGGPLIYNPKGLSIDFSLPE